MHVIDGGGGGADNVIQRDQRGHKSALSDKTCDFWSMTPQSQHDTKGYEGEDFWLVFLLSFSDMADVSYNTISVLSYSQYSQFMTNLCVHGGGGGLLAKSCLTLVTPRTVAHRLLCPWDFPGKNTRVGCHFLLQGIFFTQRSNPGLLHCRWIIYHYVTKEFMCYMVFSIN